MIAVQIGTTSWRTTDALAGNEVAYGGTFVYAPDGLTPWMVWDGVLGNVRPMTAPEIAALPAQQQAARDAAQPDLATMRDQAQAAFDGNATYLAIGAPGNAQVVAQVRALTQQNQRIIKALARLVLQAL